jgi:hypothetical protein
MNAFRQVERCKHRQADRYIDRQRHLQAGREMYEQIHRYAESHAERKGRENYRHRYLLVDRQRVF